VPNIRSDRPAETRDFFVQLLGFEVVMDMGWVVTVASPTNPSAQVTIVGNDDLAAPGISVEVADVDAVHAKAVEQGLPTPRHAGDRRSRSGVSARLAIMPPVAACARGPRVDPSARPDRRG